MSEFSEEFKATIRDFITRKGEPIEFRREYWMDEDDPLSVSEYGWRDIRASYHCLPNYKWNKDGGCHWVVPEGTFLYEETYSMFDGTGCDNRMEEGVNIRGCHCACGKYRDITLRWTGTLADLINHIAPKTEEEKGWYL